MSVFTKQAASIFAPQDAGGTPRSVVNGEAQTWGTELERIIDAAVAAGNFLLYETKAALDADLAHDANTAALVVGDSTSNDGLYVKSGASGAGSWSRVGDVPGYSFIRATDAGGSANAIAATTALPINESQLIVLPINITNTGTPVTVSFNGGSALTIKTAAGNNPAIGGLVSGTVVAGYKDGSTFRMLSDQASTAIQAAAEAAQAAAEAAEAGAEAARDAALAAVPAPAVANVAAMAALDTSTYTRAFLADGIPAMIGKFGMFSLVLVAGLTAAQLTARAADTNNGIFVDSTHDANYVWMRENRGEWHTSWFDVASGDDVAPEWNAMIAAANAMKPKKIVVDPGTYYADSALTKFAYIFALEGSPSSGSPPIIAKRYVEATNDRGLLHSDDFGGVIKGLNVRAAAGSTGGCLITFKTTATGSNVGEIRIRDCIISPGAAGRVRDSLHLNGDTSTVAPLGLRDIYITDCYIFDGDQYAVRASSCQSFSMIGGTIAAVLGGQAMVLTGTASVNSDNCQILTKVGGNLTVTRTSNSHFQHVSGNVNNDSTVTDTTIGVCEGTIDNNWGAGCGHFATGLHSSGAGWEKRYDGWFRQWGTSSTDGSGDASVSFPKSFASAPKIFGAEITDDAGTGFKAANCDTPTTTSMAVKAFGFTTTPTAGPISANFAWFAEGY